MIVDDCKINNNSELEEEEENIEVLFTSCFFFLIKFNCQVKTVKSEIITKNNDSIFTRRIFNNLKYFELYQVRR